MPAQIEFRSFSCRTLPADSFPPSPSPNALDGVLITTTDDAVAERAGDGRGQGGRAAAAGAGPRRPRKMAIRVSTRFLPSAGLCSPWRYTVLTRRCRLGRLEVRPPAQDGGKLSSTVSTPLTSLSPFSLKHTDPAQTPALVHRSSRPLALALPSQHARPDPVPRGGDGRDRDPRRTEVQVRVVRTQVRERARVLYGKCCPLLFEHVVGQG